MCSLSRGPQGPGVSVCSTPRPTKFSFLLLRLVLSDQLLLIRVVFRHDHLLHGDFVGRCWLHLRILLFLQESIGKGLVPIASTPVDMNDAIQNDQGGDTYDDSGDYRSSNLFPFAVRIAGSTYSSAAASGASAATTTGTAAAPFTGFQNVDARKYIQRSAFKPTVTRQYELSFLPRFCQEVCGMVKNYRRTNSKWCHD